MAKMMSPNTTIWWVPASATIGTAPGTPYDPDAPSLQFLTDARNISCAVVTGYTLNPTDSDTDDSTSICDSANVETPTFYNYEANVTFFREGDSANTTSDYYKAFQFFKQADAEGYLVRRVGYRNTVAAAAGHIVDSFKVSSDNPQDVVDDGGPIQMTVPFLPQGKMSLEKALVA